jgi:hypothetical protein
MRVMFPHPLMTTNKLALSCALRALCVGQRPRLLCNQNA